MKKKIHLVAAARPNFMKIAPLYHALKKESWFESIIIHTGQHYDFNMSDAFFHDLNLPEPHIHLGVGKGSHSEQTGQVMIEYEKVLQQNRPDLVVVVGDVNSTMACALSSVKIGTKVAHLEAGLRSFDRTMPEEINRIVTDTLADLLWTHSPDADENLIREGIAPEKIERVGNIMIDSLEMVRSKIEKDNTFPKFKLSNNGFGLVTLHRPSNVDIPKQLENICNVLIRIGEKRPLIFPLHPRTRKNLEYFGLYSILEKCSGISLSDPLNYIPFINLVFHCSFVITDSGGIQEETTYLDIPCFTLRDSTERPITVSQGTNQLCSTNNIEDKVNTILTKNKKSNIPIDLWDGKTANRVAKSIRKFLNY